MLYARTIGTHADNTIGHGQDISRSVRIARKEDFTTMVDIAQRAFIHDPLYNYLGDVKQMTRPGEDTPQWRNLRTVLTFVLNCCLDSGGRATLAVERKTDNQDLTGSERILAVSLWMPPGKHLSPWKVRTLVKSGLLDVFRIWGLKGFLRSAFEDMDGAERSFRKAYQSKGITISIEESWYLELVATEPEYQRQGLASLLMRESFVHGGTDEIYLLEATTASSRDFYLSLGYELVDPLILGKGVTNEQGLCVGGEGAEGFAVYPMARWAKAKPRQD